MFYSLIFNLSFSCLTAIIIREIIFLIVSFFPTKKKKSLSRAVKPAFYAMTVEAEWLGVLKELRGDMRLFAFILLL